jgi:hypothetical protein
LFSRDPGRRPVDKTLRCLRATDDVAPNLGTLLDSDVPQFRALPPRTPAMKVSRMQQNRATPNTSEMP